MTGVSLWGNIAFCIAVAVLLLLISRGHAPSIVYWLRYPRAGRTWYVPTADARAESVYRQLSAERTRRRFPEQYRESERVPMHHVARTDYPLRRTLRHSLDDRIPTALLDAVVPGTVDTPHRRERAAVCTARVHPTDVGWIDVSVAAVYFFEVTMPGTFASRRPALSADAGRWVPASADMPLYRGTDTSAVSRPVCRVRCDVETHVGSRDTVVEVRGTSEGWTLREKEVYVTDRAEWAGASDHEGQTLEEMFLLLARQVIAADELKVRGEGLRYGTDVPGA